MNVHKNARLTPHRRAELVGRISAGERVIEVARQLGISRRTASKWTVRYRAEGHAGLADRSSRPHSSPRRTAAAIALGMKVLRMQRWTCAEIAHAVGVLQRTTNGQDPTHTEIGTVKILPRDADEFIAPTGDHHDDLSDLERELGLQ